MDALLRRRLMMLGGGGPTPPPTPQPVFYERIRFDGTAWIDTGILLPANGSVRVSTGGETRKGNQGIFNALNSTDNVVLGIWLTTQSSSSKRVFAHRYQSSTTGTGNPQVNNWTDRAGIFLGPTKWGTSGTALNTVVESNPPTQGIVLGAASSGYRYTGALGYFYVYDSTASGATSYANLRDNYTPIYTMRPCLYNGEAGVWIVETNTFRGNSAGEGTLSVEGNIVTP